MLLLIFCLLCRDWEQDAVIAAIIQRRNTKTTLLFMFSVDVFWAAQEEKRKDAKIKLPFVHLTYIVNFGTSQLYYDSMEIL